MDKDCYKDKICYMIDKLIGIEHLDIFNGKNREFSLQTIFDIVGFYLLVESKQMMLNRQLGYHLQANRSLLHYFRQKVEQ